MSDRKAELERKRKKVEDLRKAREASALLTGSGSPSSSSSVESSRGSTPNTSVSTTAEQVQELVSSLLGTSTASHSSGTTAAGNDPNNSSTASNDVEAASTSVPDVSKSIKAPSQQQTKNLIVSELVRVNVLPKEIIMYTKEVQTDDILIEEDEDIQIKSSLIEQQQQQLQQQQQQQQQKQQQQKTDDNENHAVKEESKELSEEERSQILKSSTFLDFFDKTTKIVERALNESYDIAVDYRGGYTEEDSSSALSDKVTLVSKFSDERWSANRTVTCIDWSSKYPEVLAAGYNASLESSQNSDGVLLLWNLHLPQRPELVFNCQSAVMSTAISKFNPHLIVGGTYSGTIVLWDTRAKSAPVQRTPLSTACHAHPVYNVQFVGTQNANNLITVSNDGKMCTWSLDMLSQPQEVLQLSSGADNKKEGASDRLSSSNSASPFAVTALSFPENEINHFVAGSEDGTIGLGSRHGTKAGIHDTLSSRDSQYSHFGPVTSVHVHGSSASHKDCGDLVISSSMDWTVKLWNMRTKSLVHTFDTYGDYVYDVQWSPAHPSVFASIDGMGKFDLWNLNSDIELPRETTSVESSGAALNRLRWNESGTHIAIGDSDGGIHLYGVGERYYTPRADEGSYLRKTLNNVMQMSQKYAANPSGPGATAFGSV